MGQMAGTASLAPSGVQTGGGSKEKGLMDCSQSCLSQVVVKPGERSLLMN